ncbi:MAG: gamma-glutamyltransferase [Myxococcota bacterium]
MGNSRSQASVAAGHPEVAASAAQILRDGGNAVDAAIAGTLTSFISEVALTGPFGGGFALVGGAEAEPRAFDFFADVPGRDAPEIDLATIDFHAVEVSFGPTSQVFHVGRGAVAMSNALSGLLALHRTYGSLSIEAISAPAIRISREGTVLTPQTRMVMGILEPILRYTPESDALFAPEGVLPEVGERLANPDLANLLEGLAGGHDPAHSAALAESFGRPGGLIGASDVDAYRVKERHPIHIELKGHTLVFNPPPSSGGLLIAFGLKLLERLPESLWRDDIESTRALLAAMSTTIRARRAELDVAVHNTDRSTESFEEEFLSQTYLDRWWPTFEHARAHGPDPDPIHEPQTPGNTTHISVIDNNGLGCSLTSSNGEGCGTLVPGTGAQGNNFLGESDLNPSGFHANPVGVRLTSMMCPTLVLRDGRPLYALGSGGSNRIRTALLQVLVHRLFRGQPIHDSVHGPRLHYEHDTLFIERESGGISIERPLIDALRCTSVVEFAQPSMFFGGVHLASAIGQGAADPRRQGTVEQI